MANPPQGGDLLQGHFTLPLAATLVYGAMYSTVGTRDQVRHDEQSCTLTTYETAVNETGGPGVITIVGNNPGSSHTGTFKLTVDDVVLFEGNLSVGTLLVGMKWAAHFSTAKGPIFFRESFKLEVKRTGASDDFDWDCVYTKLDWGT